MDSQILQEKETLHKAQVAFEQHLMLPLNEHIIQNVDISENLKFFLRQVGLPQDELLGWDFNPEKYGLRYVREVASVAEKTGFENDTRRVLAEGQDVLACLDTNANGMIVAIDFSDGSQLEFINTGLLEFLSCLATFIQNESLASIKKPYTAKDFRNFRSQLVQIDSNAMASGENWWPLAIDGIDYGMHDVT